MPRILVTAAFKFAVDGLHVIEVEPGEQDVSERCAEVAVDHLQVASRLDGSQPAAVVPPVEPPAPVKPASPAKAPAKPKAAAKAKPGGAA